MTGEDRSLSRGKVGGPRENGGTKGEGELRPFCRPSRERRGVAEEKRFR